MSLSSAHSVSFPGSWFIGPDLANGLGRPRVGDVGALCNEVVSRGLLFVLQKQNQPEVYFQENFYFKHRTAKFPPPLFSLVYAINTSICFLLLYLSYFWASSW